MQTSLPEKIHLITIPMVSDRIDLTSVTPLHWLAITMALVSAAVHLVLGLGFLPHPMGVAFALAAGGYIGAIVLFLFDYRRRLLYLAGIPYTGVQIVLWYVLNQPAGLAEIPPSHAVDKIAQGLLVVALVVLYARES